MAFKKVVVTSLEDQWYRRCAQISILEALHFPITQKDLYHVIWAKPFKEVGAEPLVASLVDMGFTHWQKILEPGAISEKHMIKYYDLSLFEVQMRALQYCLGTDQNILLLADDIYFTIDYQTLSGMLHRLVDTTEKLNAPVGFCQLTYGADPDNRHTEAHRHITVHRETRNFLQGVLASGAAALFVTPYGAQQVLRFLKDPESRIDTLEVMPPLYWYDKTWMYTVAQRDLVRSITAMNGESISALVDDHKHISKGRLHHTERRKQSYSFFEKYRIPFQP